MTVRRQIHNGNLTNADALRTILQTQSELSYQRHLRTDSDSEVLLNIFADEIHRAHKARRTHAFGALLREECLTRERAGEPLVEAAGARL